MQRFESTRFSWRREEKRKEKKKRLFVKFFFNLTIEKLRIIFSPPGRKSTDQLFSSRTPQLYVYIVNSESPISFLLLPSLFFPYRGRLTRIKKKKRTFLGNSLTRRDILMQISPLRTKLRSAHGFGRIGEGRSAVNCDVYASRFVVEGSCCRSRDQESPRQSPPTALYQLPPPHPLSSPCSRFLPLCSIRKGGALSSSIFQPLLLLFLPWLD